MDMDGVTNDRIGLTFRLSPAVLSLLRAEAFGPGATRAQYPGPGRLGFEPES